MCEFTNSLRLEIKLIIIIPPPYVYYTYVGGVVNAWGRISLIVLKLSDTYKCYYT